MPKEKQKKQKRELRIAEVWRLWQALKSKEAFDELTLDEKLEALRIAIQR